MNFIIQDFLANVNKSAGDMIIFAKEIFNEKLPLLCPVIITSPLRFC